LISPKKPNNSRLDALVEILKNSDCVKEHVEYFLIQKVLKNNIDIISMSCLDGSDLRSKSKGRKIKAEKKNLNSPYIHDYDYGKTIVDKTFEYFELFKEINELNCQNYDFNSYLCKTSVSRTDNINRLIFFDTSSKIQLADLEASGKKLEKKKNIDKIPVVFCFYTRLDTICFSMLKNMVSLSTINAVISK
jgi:hypothetical protein